MRSAGKKLGAGSSKRKVASVFLLFLLICGHCGVNILFLRALPAVKCYMTTSPHAKGPSGSCEAAAKKSSCKPLLSGSCHLDRAGRQQASLSVHPAEKLNRKCTPASVEQNVSFLSIEAAFALEKSS